MRLLDGEAGLLEALAENADDDRHRSVYADWLEERGDTRSDWLRCEMALVAALRKPDGDDEQVRESIVREVASLRTRMADIDLTDADWLRAVTRMPIENCDVWTRVVRLRFRCPERWDRLEPTMTDGVRFCGACRRHVFHCDSPEAARTHARAGNRVVVSPDLPREPGDLDDVEMMLGEMEENGDIPEGLDRDTVRPFARVLRALQRVMLPEAGPTEAVGEDEASD